MLPSGDRYRRVGVVLLLGLLLLISSGCGGFGRESVTRTPVPTFTPTPMGAGGEVAPAQEEEPAPGPIQIAMPTATETSTPVSLPPTTTPTPTDTPTPIPTLTATPTPSVTPTPTEAPVPTESPTPTPTPAFTFDLEAAEKHPTESLAPNVVRVYLYVFAPDGLGLGGYSLRVTPNDTNVAPEAPAVEVTPEPVDNAEDAPSAPAPLIGAPAGLGLLQVNNGFSHEIRVTIDQRYRPDQGPSEFDLQPGTVTNIVVFPGTISFTAVRAWSNLSHNTTLDIEPDAIIPLWLRFERDSGGSWYLAWN